MAVDPSEAVVAGSATETVLVLLAVAGSPPARVEWAEVVLLVVEAEEEEAVIVEMIDDLVRTKIPRFPTICEKSPTFQLSAKNPSFFNNLPCQ